jgi:hypothetical protein
MPDYFNSISKKILLITILHMFMFIREGSMIIQYKKLFADLFSHFIIKRVLWLNGAVWANLIYHSYAFI